VNTLIDSLQKLGFSQYEAQAYVALLQHNPLNGYELARASGIPRPNIYPVLQKLEERGAVLRLETPQGRRYAPVSSQELIQRLHLHFQQSLEAARHSLSQVEATPSREHLWNLDGHAAILEHACSLIASAKETLMAAIWPDEISVLADDFYQAAQRGVKITTLCLAGCSENCPQCQGNIHRYALASSQKQRWLVLIVDQRELLAGELKMSGEALALRTCQKMLVHLAGEYINHSIALAILLKDLGPHIERLLTPESRAILETLSAGDAQGNWLQHMQQILSPKETLE
jgi:sugar-specific transcriptional regulator TrmB